MLINLNLNGLFWSDCVSTAFGLSRWGDDDDDVHVTQPPELRDIESLVTESQCSEQNKLMDSIIWNIFENWQIGSCEIYLSCKINYWSLIVMLDQARVWTYSENIEPKFSTMNRIFNPVDIMVVNVGGVMIIKFTDLHQIKPIRRLRGERPIFLILPRLQVLWTRNIF